MKNKVLVINCGSTSTKYKYLDNNGVILEENNFGIGREELILENNFLTKIKNQILKEKNKLKIAFRVVHGGDLKGPLELTKKVIEKIKDFSDFAPIHNNAFLKKYKNIKKFFNENNDSNNISFFAVFDTDFHQTIPKKNSLYAIDSKISEEFKIKKYGFHGIAVESALNNLKINLEKEKKEIPQKIIFAHLGGGSSLTAVVNEKSIANTMELTPISGLVMVSRVGDVDSDLDIILAKRMNKQVSEISHILSFESGLFGLAGTKDIKDIFEKAQIEKKEKKGVYKKEELAFDIYFEKLIEKIFAMTGKMNGVDMIVFSGGTGYRNEFLRKEVEKRVRVLRLSEKDFFITKVNEGEVIFDKVKEL